MSVFDHFVGLALKGLDKVWEQTVSSLNVYIPLFSI